MAPNSLMISIYGADGLSAAGVLSRHSHAPCGGTPADRNAEALWKRCTFDIQRSPED